MYISHPIYKIFGTYAPLKKKKDNKFEDDGLGLLNSDNEDSETEEILLQLKKNKKKRKAPL